MSELINNHPKYFFEHKKHIFERIQQENTICLFLDYDGTLIPFEKRPDEVQTPDHLLHMLKNLSEIDSIKIILITGRPLNQIIKLVTIDTINYAAVHGIHIKFSNGKIIIMNEVENVKQKMNQIKKRLERTLHKFKGGIIEDKQYSIAFHYRLMSEKDKQKYLPIIKNSIYKYQDETIEIIEGKKVLEIRSKGWNKGNAVDYFLHQINSNNKTLPIYIGDDTTDEDAFSYLKNKGITVFVKNNSSLKTNAEYWVDNPSKVYQILHEILEIKK